MRRARARWVAVLPLALACASGPPPWKVDAGEERRFRGTLDTCHKLTDASDGQRNPEAFERCMTRRGFRRQFFWERWFRVQNTFGASLPG